MSCRIAILGDQFMKAEVFQSAITDQCGSDFDFRTHEYSWPDQPMEMAGSAAGSTAIAEYFGTAETVIEVARDAAAIITHLAPLSAEVFRALPNLKFVAVARGGPVNVDMTAAAQHNIRVVNAPGRNSSAVAEFTIGAIIAQTRNITRGHDALRQGDWRGELYRADEVGDEISDMVIGVVGYGHVGSKVVRLLRAFGATVLVCDPFVQLNALDAADTAIHKVDLDTLLAQSDVVTLHARVTPQTRGMINADTLGQMKAGATLINTARGPLVDYQALYQALTLRKLRGAMIETFAAEPVIPDDPLLRLPKVTLTPHIAGASLKTVRIAAAQAAEELRRWLASEPPLNPCR